MKKAKLEDPRSPCPISCSLEIIGDKWTLLVIRDLILGKARFKDFTASPESIPTNILSERLSRLVEYGIIIQEPVSGSSKRYQYKLTSRGTELVDIVLQLADWGMKHISGTSIAAAKRVLLEE